ncbi:hypothetical protein EI94DRAFT_1716301 [Lactarius quietus]|nr:hypothetical protein EI94DRAFT_1716301 [Lactarius quietus]
MRWKLPHVFPYLLGTTVFVLPSVISRSSDDPLQSTFQVPPESSACGSDLGWTFPPSPNSTHHLIFNSVSGLLQRWPNILHRNGHSLIPATIPKGTILYHGRTDDQIPDPPDWLAFDFEHAFFFCRGPCYVITLQAKRDLRLVYFDGASAAKMKGGPLDSQDVIMWGRPQPDKVFSEIERINALCDWGRPFGLDGFIRMGFNFEFMMCDVLDAMEVVSFLNLIPMNQTSIPTHFPGLPFPLPPPLPFKPPSGWRGSLPNGYRSFSEAYVAGSWHDHAPGETRIRLDYSGLVTFYDPSLSSLVEARYRKDRLHLRLEGISALDSERIRAELETVLTREPELVSGIDWSSIVQVVTNRYAGRLEYLRSLLSPRMSIVGALERASVARAQLLVMLAPYITTADVPKRLPASADLSWAAPIALRCATTQTSHIPLGMLTPQEARIHAAVENTLHEICRRLALVWVEFFDVEAADEAEASEAFDVAHGHIEELMTWLDWSAWVRCEPGCTVEETCYAPAWPFLQGDDPCDMSPRCVPLSVTAFW